MKEIRDLKEYIELLLTKSTAENPYWNKEKIQSGKANTWNYIDGCMIYAILELYKITKEKKYLDFTVEFVNSFVDEEGNIRTYEVEEYNLDNINPGKNLFTLYDLTGDERYKKALHQIYRQIKEMPRTPSGNFWHKEIYPHQVWLDGIYMAMPFYMEYETRFNAMRNYKDIYHQLLNVRDKMRDPETGLYFHGFDESREMFWADKEKGTSPNFWLRALGWFLMGLVDTLEKMDNQIYHEYREIKTMLNDLVKSLVKYQDESGMFYQIIDKKDDERNYLETSGSAIIAFGLLKAVRLGFIHEKYKVNGEKAFYGTMEKYLDKNEHGELQLGGICLVAGLGGKDRRDGTLEYYFSEPVVQNEAKGVAPLIMAYTEIIKD